jgi:hypothetical protein
MFTSVLSARFDIPFYFRLPSSAFFTWDPEYGTAAIYPKQHLGEITFSKESSKFVSAKKLLDSTSKPIEGLFYPKILMTCETKGFGEVPTLHIDTGPTGGFSELRAYSELSVFIVIEKDHDPFSRRAKARIFDVLNNFIDIYRIITQDPYVHRIDGEFDTYLVDYSAGVIPKKYHDSSSGDILKHIQKIAFHSEIGKGRQLKTRLNTLEDLFPGKILEKSFLDLFGKLTQEPYNNPIHYELIFNAQFELKRRNYHIAVLEAETAFEVYIAQILLNTAVAIGEVKSKIIADMENPKKLGMLNQRLIKVDSLIEEYRKSQGLSASANFMGSAFHNEWKNYLYKLRNKIIHEGWRFVTFDQAKRGIASCKSAIKEIEDHLPGIADKIQIYPGISHIQNTAGRLKF